jgi:hypothetical protein
MDFPLEAVATTFTCTLHLFIRTLPKFFKTHGGVVGDLPPEK